MAETTHEGRSGARTLEHTLAWIFVIVALAAATLSLLVGFDVVDLNIRDDGVSVNVEGVGQAEVGDAAATEESYFRDALLWMIPAATAGMISLALHRTDHHRTVTSENHAGSSRPGMFGVEHAFAYLALLAAMAASVLGILAGYDVFDNGNTVEDGYLWGLSGFVVATVSVALHSVRHHALAADEEVIARLIEERSARATPARTEPAHERRDEPVI